MMQLMPQLELTEKSNYIHQLVVNNHNTSINESNEMWAFIIVPTIGTQVFVKWMENKLGKTEPGSASYSVSFNQEISLEHLLRFEVTQNKQKKNYTLILPEKNFTQWTTVSIISTIILGAKNTFYRCLQPNENIRSVQTVPEDPARAST